jgi:hypothetical protein
MNEKDYKHCQLISSFIEQFESGDLKMSKLISMLEGSINSLQTLDEELKEQLRSEWWTLEQVYSVALDQQESELSPESKNLVIEALRNIKSILQEYNHLPSP